MESPDALKIISGAVTPVVMISAIALLNLGISNRSAVLADRLRSLAVEFRSEHTGEERKASIQAQAPWLMRRFAYSSRAQWALYTAMVFFVAAVLSITLIPDQTDLARLKIGLFVVGILLTLVAVMLESMEIRSAHQSLHLEMLDVLGNQIE